MECPAGSIQQLSQLDEETQGMTIPQFLAYVHRGAVECQRLMDERKAVCEKETTKDGN